MNVKGFELVARFRTGTNGTGRWTLCEGGSETDLLISRKFHVEFVTEEILRKELWIGGRNNTSDWRNK